MRQPYKFTQSKRMWSTAKKLIAGGSQGTRTPEFPESPSYFTRAKGCRMWDVDGNEFIDLLCSIGPVILGYAYPRVDRAVREVMEDSFQSSMNHPNQLELAKLLIDYIPCAERVRFLKTGTEATLAAVRLARQVTGRPHVARHGYHGWADIWWHGFDIDKGVDKEAWAKVPKFDGTAEGLERVFKETGKPFGAVILCPVDTRPFTKENFQGIVDVAHRHGALVIFDEIKSGFRSAPGGAQEVLGVTPDLTTLSKAIANGYPLSAVVGKAQYMESMPKTPTAGTFSVEAISIAAAVATLRELKEKNVAAHLRKMGRRLIDGLNEICKSHTMEGPLAYPDPFEATPRFMFKPHTEDFTDPAHRYFFSQCLRFGLFFVPWHVGFVNYSHKEKDIDQALDICDLAMGKTRKKFGHV